MSAQAKIGDWTYGGLLKWVEWINRLNEEAILEGRVKVEKAVSPVTAPQRDPSVEATMREALCIEARSLAAYILEGPQGRQPTLARVANVLGLLANALESAALPSASRAPEAAIQRWSLREVDCGEDADGDPCYDGMETDDAGDWVMWSDVQPASRAEGPREPREEKP